MDYIDGTCGTIVNHDMSSLVEPGFVRLTSKYLRRLIVEAPYIYERLYNPSGSIILQQHQATPEYTNRYSTTIGNTFHNDLIDAAILLRTDFTREERRLLYDWAMGMNAYQAAEYYGVTGDVVRKRRSRAVSKLKKALDEPDTEDA